MLDDFSFHMTPDAEGRQVRRVSAPSDGAETVSCEVNIAVGAVMLSIPDVLGALALKGAAYLEDSRDGATPRCGRSSAADHLSGI